MLDIKGRQFGRLYVNDFHEKRNGRSYWKCTCSCGQERIVMGTNLTVGETKSCGCLNRDVATARIKQVKKQIEKGGSGLNRVMSAYIRHAKERGLSFHLSREEFRRLTSQNCHFCNKPPDMKSCTKYPRMTVEGNLHSLYIHNGIDRINPTLGYFNDNCVPCCKYCNRAKSDMTLDQFVSWIRKVYNRIDEFNAAPTGNFDMNFFIIN